jgi:hypothetical protein
MQAASHASGDAARPLPRLTIALAEANCNGRDAVANESTEALQRRAKESAVCQLQLVVRPSGLFNSHGNCCAHETIFTICNELMLSVHRTIGQHDSGEHAY